LSYGSFQRGLSGPFQGLMPRSIFYRYLLIKVWLPKYSVLLKDVTTFLSYDIMIMHEYSWSRE